MPYTHLECCRVHSYENICTFPRGTYSTRAYLHLIARYPTQGTLRCTNFSWEVRERGNGVPRHGGKVREDRPRQLHPITRVSRESNDDVFERFDRFLFVHSSLYI